MNLYIKYYYKQQSTYTVIAIIIISRLTQVALSTGSKYSDYINDYSIFFNFQFISFVLPIVYCIWIFSSFPLLQDEKIILRSGSRLKVLLLQGKLIFADALSFAVLLNITALPIVFFQYSSAVNHLPYFFFSFVLQFLYFLVCSLFYSIFYLLFSKSYVSALVVVVYGAIDYLAMNIVKTVTWSCGSGRVAIADLKTASVNIPFLFSIVIFLTVISEVILSKKNFIGKAEENHE